MKKNIIRIAILCVILTLYSFIFVIHTNASDQQPEIGGKLNPDYYEPKYNPAQQGGTITSITSKANIIVGIIKTIGVVVAAITMIMLGIKYMMASVEEKAEYKKSMIPYIIGAFLFLSISQLLGIVISMVSELK